MTWFGEETSESTGATSAGLLRIAAGAYLARYKGTSRMHTASDLRIYLGWCADRDVDPLEAQRVDVELYVRWSQEVRRFRPSTVSRRLSVVCGFYHTCVIDGVLEHSPADHVRRPHVPAESPTLSLSHLQFEAAIDRAVADRVSGPILLNSRGARMDRHAATRRLHRLAEAAVVRTEAPSAHAPPHVRDHHAGRRR